MFVKITKSVSGKRIRLTEERWQHICERHPEVAEYLDKVLKTVTDPEIITKGWTDYDQKADVLYISFGKPQKATDTVPTDEGILVRKDGKKIIGFTILNASRFLNLTAKSS